MIYKINGNQAFRVSIAPGISEEDFVKNHMREDMIVNNDVVEDFPFLKYENGKISKDESFMEDLYSNEIKALAKELLSKTDYLMLIDNPSNLTEEELSTIIDFRKTIRGINKSSEKQTVMFSVPTLLKDKYDFASYFKEV